MKDLMGCSDRNPEDKSAEGSMDSGDPARHASEGTEL